MDRHFIKEKIENSIIKLPLVRSEADILTKAVSKQAPDKVLTKLSIGDPLLTLRGSIRIS
ncbi:hypothetical protein AHAS_Ahas04G0225600 [Arachis hypogaea]